MTDYYLKYNINGKTVFIIREHRYALLCWKKSIDEGAIKEGSTLFHIDKHSDTTLTKNNILQSEKILSMSNSELLKFVDNKLSKDNSEFILNAMIGGIIKDAISISTLNHFYNGKMISGTYATTNKFLFIHKEKHNIFLSESESVGNIFGYQNLIGDTCVHQDTTKLYNETEYLILDIDLDFFTYSYDGSFPKHKTDIEFQLNSKFQDVWNKADIITIALEPKCCGGEENSLEILDYFLDVFFDKAKEDIMKETKQFVYGGTEK